MLCGQANKVVAEADGADITPKSLKAAEGTRTHDLRFTKPLLYQLSYGGARPILSRPDEESLSPSDHQRQLP